MNWRISSGTVFTTVLSLAVSLSACTTAQQSPGQDKGDNLFLKYVEISKRPSLVTADDMAEINHLTALISARKNPCELAKNDAMRKVRRSVLNNYKYGAAAEDLASDHAEARRELKRIAAASMQACDGHGFPQVAID